MPLSLPHLILTNILFYGLLLSPPVTPHDDSQEEAIYQERETGKKFAVCPEPGCLGSSGTIYRKRKIWRS